MEEKIAHAAGEGCAVHSRLSEAIWAMADEAQLEEIVLALVSHDREDARERSHVSIGCGIDTIAENLPGMTLAPGAYAVLTIHDDGQGLDRTNRAAVFEGFLSKQGEKTSGPALARAYATVREWGGDIAFFSEPFRGSTFLIYLPHCEAPAETAPGRRRVEPVIPEPPVGDCPRNDSAGGRRSGHSCAGPKNSAARKLQRSRSGQRRRSDGDGVGGAGPDRSSGDRRDVAGGIRPRTGGANSRDQAGSEGPLYFRLHGR